MDGDNYEQLVWVIDGAACYSKVIHKWRLNVDGTVEIEGRVAKWKPFK